MSKNNYGADKISVLKGLEAVRKRPAMYIGDVGKRGYHHLVSEVVDNSIDEALAGFCTSIIVTIKNDGFISIEDNGRGIPVEIHKTEGKPALEVVMTVLHAGGKFDKNTYKVSGGLHGVGVSVVNALSENLVAEVHRDGFHYKQEYKIGQPTTEVEKIGKSDKTGTIVSFKPDETVFSHKRGHIFSEILNNWKFLVGESLFKVCFPKSFKNSNKFGVSTLLIMVKRGHEIDLEYSKKEIMDKVNNFFGNTVIEKIKFTTFEEERKQVISDKTEKRL